MIVVNIPIGINATYHVTYVTYHVTYVTYHVTYVTYHVTYAPVLNQSANAQ